MFMEETIGTRINVERADEIIGSGAGTVAVAVCSGEAGCEAEACWSDISVRSGTQLRRLFFSFCFFSPLR